MELYEVKNLSFRYAGTAQKALRTVSFSVKSGDFLLLTGDSGSGKTTLLKLLKPETAPAGETGGTLLYKTLPMHEVPAAQSAAEIGFTAQNPNVQNAAQLVKNELVFLLKNLSYSDEQATLRAAQTVSFFGTQALYNREIHTLSGGEKQMVHLQSVFAAAPRVLLLDEPLAQLDPFSTERFLQALYKIQAETDVSVILSSHNILPLLPLANAVLHLQNGTGTFYESCDAYLTAHPSAALPSAVFDRLRLPLPTPVPKTAAACCAALKPYRQKISIIPKQTLQTTAKQPVLSFHNVSFRYQKNEPDVLSDLNFNLYAGEVFAVVGANGAGKSTFLSLAAGRTKPYFGKIRQNGQPRLALVPQNPQAVFAYDSVLEILEAAEQPPSLSTLYLQFKSEKPASEKTPSAAVQRVAQALGLAEVLLQNPFDLSGGQQQSVALAGALLQNPDILLFDEVTKGLEENRKHMLTDLLARLKTQGKAILLVTHDLDFAAEAADRAALLFDGKLLGSAPVHTFFTGNTAYTSSVAKIFADEAQKHRPISMEEVHRAQI